MQRRGLAYLMLPLALSACGGGGSSSLPPTSPGSSSGGSTTQKVSVSLLIPAKPALSARLRRPAYVSTQTQSASISVNGGTPVVIDLAPGAPGCTTTSAGRSCVTTVSAPSGSDIFSEKLYASVDASGPVLSQGTSTATITPGTNNVVNLTLGGVPAVVTLQLADAAPPQDGRPQTIALTATIKDAGGATIVGSDPLDSPITLTDSDGSGITALSKTTLASPADAANLTVTYTGARLKSPATFGATGTGITANTIVLTPTTFNDYVTFGFDNQRDVFNPNSTAISPKNLPKLHLAWQTNIADFNTQTQPILATNVGGHAGVLYVGGGSGQMDAIDALTGAKLWNTQTGEMSYSACGATSYFGIGGTAAYDAASNAIYVVGNSNNVIDAYGSNTLYRLNATNGHIEGQVNFAPARLNQYEQNFGHTSVTLSNGIAYVGLGTTCDISSWRGEVVAINVQNSPMTIAHTFSTTYDPLNTQGNGAQSFGGGGIWGWGGVSLDYSGNVLTGVGNADNGISNGTIAAPYTSAPSEYSGFAESLLELSPTITSVVADNHPIPTSLYGAVANDLDVQGTPLVIQPTGTGCDTMVALQGKSGELTLYNENRINAGYQAQFQLGPASSEDSYLGSPAYSPVTNLVYADVASSVSPSLYAPGLISIDPGCGNPSVLWHASFGSDSSDIGLPRSVPAVSAGGVVFAGSVAGDAGQVWAIDASSGAVLNGGAALLQTSGHIRMPATIDGDWVYVLDNNGNLYGLTIDPNFAPIAPQAHARDARSTEGYPFRRKH